MKSYVLLIDFSRYKELVEWRLSHVNCTIFIEYEVVLWIGKWAACISRSTDVCLILVLPFCVSMADIFSE